MSRDHNRLLISTITEAILGHLASANKFAYDLDKDQQLALLRRVRYRVRRMLEGKKLNGEV